MAVTTTTKKILTAAYAKSKKNNPGAIATEATELLGLVQRALTGLYAVAARVNPLHFAESAAVEYSDPGWARPETAESVFRIERSDGTEVVVVPFDDRSAESGLPGVYRFGQIYRIAVTASGPETTEALTFFYSKRPTKPADTGSTLDPLWNESYNELLALEVAIYLALKDDRGGELVALRTDRDRWALQFLAFLEHETVGERRRFANVQRFNKPSVVPIGRLFAGGSTVGVAA